MTDFGVQVYDSTLAKTTTMTQVDAQFCVQNFPTRFSYVTLGAAQVPSTNLPIPGSLATIPDPGLAAACQPPANFRNLLDGGDFSVNPWQRGTSFTSIANTATYTADRWAGYGASTSSISVSQQAISNGVLPGFLDALQFGRASSNTDVNVINLGQTLETLDVIRLQGQMVTLSFYALAGANFSSLNSILNVAMYMGTGTNETITKFFKAASSGWAGYQNLAVAAGSNAAALTTTWQRFYVTFQVPTTATELGVLFNYTPVGTAGSNDWFQITGAQLEVGAFPSAFEHRDVQVELEICQRYAYQINEPGAGVIVGIGGAVAAANNQVFYMALPVQMRAAPTVTVSAGTFKVCAATTAAAATGMAAGSTHTVNAIEIVSTLTQTVGLAASLQGGGGTGYILASADL